jgi:hypothetical protein
MKAHSVPIYNDMFLMNIVKLMQQRCLANRNIKRGFVPIFGVAVIN